MSADKNRPNHPTPDQLEAWADGALDPAAKAELERHLAECEECRMLAEDLRDFAGLGAAAGISGEGEEADAALGRFRLRMLAEELAAGEGSESGGPESTVQRPFAEGRLPPQPPPPRPSYLSPAFGLATLTALALGIFLLQQVRAVERLGQELAAEQKITKELSARVGEIVPNSRTAIARPLKNLERGPGDAAPARRGALVQVVPEESLPDGSGWRVVIEDRTGSRLHEVPGLTVDAGQLTFFLPPEKLPPGEYRLRLYHGDEPLPDLLGLTLTGG